MKKNKSELKQKTKKSYMLLSQTNLKDTNPSLCSWFVTRACYSRTHTLTLSSLISWGCAWKFSAAAPGEQREIVKKHRARVQSPTCLQAGRLRSNNWF